MYFLTDEMIDTLKSDPSMTGVKIADLYDVDKMTVPMVTISESPGQGYLFPDGHPQYIRTLFQVEAYAKQGNGKSANKRARELLSAADAVLYKKYGLTQQGEAVFAPYMEDRTVVRGVIRYYAVIDTKTNYIYRYV